MLNDRNGRVVNWWRVVRDQPEEFGWLVEHTPFSREEYVWACQAVDDQELPAIRRALAFQILVTQCINGGDNSLSGGSWNRKIKPPNGTYPSRFTSAAIGLLGGRECGMSRWKISMRWICWSGRRLCGHLLRSAVSLRQCHALRLGQP